MCRMRKCQREGGKRNAGILREDLNIYLVFESTRVPMYTSAPYAGLGVDEGA